MSDNKKDEVLFGGDYRESVVQFAKSNKALVVFMFFQTIITAFCMVGYFNMYADNIVIKISLPNGTVTVSPNRASDDYFELWGKHLISKVSNFAPSTVQKITQDINQKIDPESYANISEQLKGFAQGVYYGGFSQTFVPTRVKTETSPSKRSAVVAVVGRATRTASDGALVFDKACDYRISLNLREGDVYVTGFTTSCK